MKRNAVFTPARISFAVVVGLVSIPSVLCSQQAFDPDAAVDGEKRAAIVEAVILAVDSLYISSEGARRVADALRRNARDGAYAEYGQLGPFIRKLTADLREQTNDRHTGVWPYDPSYEEHEITDAQKQEMLERARYSNFGFKEVRRLPGNIGLLEITDFYPADAAGRTAIAALDYLSGSDALIIDLRRNGGGSGDLVSLLLSHFFSEPVLHLSMYSRFNDETRQAWTQAYTPGPRLADIPLYVLVSGRTASAAEHFAFSLQARGRATVVGSTTRGASNPAEYVSFPELSISVQVPAYTVTEPVTGTNWEGVGVQPDLTVHPDQALFTAAESAAIRLLESASDDERVTTLRWASEMFEAQRTPLEIDDETVGRVSGRYGRSFAVTLDQGRLLLRQPSRASEELIPLGDGRFAVQGMEWRIQFTLVGDQEATELRLVYPNGNMSVYRRAS
jgi:hypothetical protein